MDVGQVCSYCYSGTVKLSEPHPERPRLWTGGLYPVLYCSWSRLELHNWISHPTFPLFSSLICGFFSAAAWFSPSISLISSSQPFPVMSSNQQMFFYPRTQGDVCLDVDVFFSVIRWGVLLFSSFAAQFWLGTFGLISLFERWIFCNLSLRFRSPHSEHTLAPILPNPAASSVALNF